MDDSPPGSSVQGISQSRILEYVAISFSKRSSWSRDWTWAAALKTVSLLSEHQGNPFCVWKDTKVWAHWNIPLICTSATWNWYPVLSYPELPQGLPTGHPLFTDMTSNIFHSQVIIYYIYNIGFPKWYWIHLQCRRHRRYGFDHCFGKIPWKRIW